MIFFMIDHCSYCEKVRELYLEPMMGDRRYTDRILMRMVNVGSIASMQDFNGKSMSQRKFADNQGIGITPVIRFYDYRGRELVPELVGYNSPYFYQAYLDRAIDGSVAALRGRP